MSLATGTRLGPYELISVIGAGGMGEVYRARDTRLERVVAIKVLPSHLSENDPMKQRFEREARAISSLSHPNICALYDIGHQDGISYLVMEFLEGQTLSDRLEKGALPLEQVLRYGIQIADALDKAHRQGIIHRDLKPGNIMITRSGVKLLDFGLAKLQAPLSHPAQHSVSALPTEQRDLTVEGTILGTLQYMSPEQLEGKEADARTDIFALGTILYEMATGKKAFKGTSQASLIASILSSEPTPITQIQPMSPPAFDRVVRNCIAKDPEERWQTAHDVMLELKSITETGSQVGLPATVLRHRKSRERIAWLLATILGLTTLGLAALLIHFKQAVHEDNAIYAFIPPPEKTSFAVMGSGGFAISPDAKTLAFVARTQNGKNTLWLQSLSETGARPLPGTDEAEYPFWSPDNKFLGFFADEKLKKIDTSGGSPITICDVAEEPRGGTWNKEGIIVFSPSRISPLLKVSASGGVPIEFTKFDKIRADTTHRWPEFLPDGQHVVYLASPNISKPQSEAIFLASLDGKQNRLLLSVRSNPLFASGHLLYLQKGALFARPFDLKRVEFTGESTLVAENILYDWTIDRAVVSTSQKGIFAYQAALEELNSQLVWFDRNGKDIGSFPETAVYYDPRISPDGKRVAVGIGKIGKGVIWISDPSGQTKNSLTFGSHDSWSPVWSPDGNRIVFSLQPNKFGDLYEKSVSGGASEKILLQTDFNKNAMDWSADGKFIAYGKWDPVAGTKYDIWILPLTGEGKPFPILNANYDEDNARFSPDAKWMAYDSNESGRKEIYVRSFPNPGGKWRISTSGGAKPKWRADGKELFFIAPDDQLMAVDVKSGATFEATFPKPVFKLRVQKYQEVHYDVSPDGQRFLFRSDLADASSSMISLLINWPSKVKR